MNKFELLEQFRLMETFCFQAFSSPTKKAWGTMFYNPELPERHDANHAEVIDPVIDPFIVTKEVFEFYSQRNIPARINFYDPDINHPFKRILADENFKCLDTDSITTFMVLQERIKLEDFLNNKDNLHVSFTPALPLESPIAIDIAKVLHSDWTYQNLASDNNYYYFILYDLTLPVSVLSYFLFADFMLARLDDVVTLPDKRNK